MKKANLILLMLFVILTVISCGGGGGGGGVVAPPPTPATTHSVTLSWAPNHETGVNKTGGGYQISISGQPTINVPFVSGISAPTSTTVVLKTGSYSMSVRAYAALDAQGGNSGTLSTSSAPIVVNVP